jgi:outer membrane protein TolC
MIRRLICAGAAACLLAAPLAAEPGLPLEEAVAAALAEHPSVIAARARLEAARA